MKSSPDKYGKRYFNDRILSGEQRRKKLQLSQFKTDRVAYRELDRNAFHEGLERNGSKAVIEFVTHFE